MDDELLSRIEDASLNASAPPQQRWLDGWLVRFAPGKARRARCVNAVATGRTALSAKLRYVQQLYEAEALPMVVRITRFTQPASLDAELAALGFGVQGLTQVQVKPGLQSSATALLPSLPPGVVWRALDPDALAEAVGALRESPVAHRLSHATRMKLSPVPCQGYAIYSEGELDGEAKVLACGHFAREGDLVGLYDVFTHPAARKQGLASMLCERMLSIAASEGAKTAYLQVEAANTAALSVYARLGFVDGYSYHYREPPGAG